MEKITHTQRFLPQTRAVGNNRTGKNNIQKKRNVVDEEFDPEEKDKGGSGHFFPAIWSNFRNLGVVVHKEKLII